MALRGQDHGCGGGRYPGGRSESGVRNPRKRNRLTDAGGTPTHDYHASQCPVQGGGDTFALDHSPGGYARYPRVRGVARSLTIQATGPLEIRRDIRMGVCWGTGKGASH